MTISGTSGDDVLGGNANDNVFDLSQGGNDTASAKGGSDIFNMGGTLNADDKLDGGSESDIVSLDGDYSAGLIFKATTIVNVEQIDLAAGHSYKLTTIDANLAIDPTVSSFTFNAAALGAADHATFNASAELDTFIYLYGGAGDDHLTGGQHANNFILSQGGNDTATGGAGQDSFYVGGTLTATDRLNGGGAAVGNLDSVVFDGDYSTQLVLAPSTVKNINNFILYTGHDYNLKISDGTFAAGGFANTNGSAIDAAHHLIFDGSAETDSRLQVIGSAGNDIITGGALADILTGGSGGNDTLRGGTGDDGFNFGPGFTSADRVNGGAGNDVLNLLSDTTVVLGSATVTGVEKFLLRFGHAYDITVANKTVAAGQTLTVDTTNLIAGDTAKFNGGSETDGHFILNGGADTDTFIGGATGDNIKGGDGADKLTGGGAADIFAYDAVSNSTGSHYDRITDFHSGSDQFDLNVTVSGVDSAISAGQLRSAAFNADLATSIGAGQLASGHGVLFTPDSGSLAGHTILVVDANGTAGYQADADYVFDVTGGVNLNALGTSDFI